MNVASGYGVASSYGNYGAEKTLPASSKSFVISAEELADERTMQSTQTQKVSTKIGLIGHLSFVGERGYSPFRDIAETGSVNFPKSMQTKTTPTRSDEEILKDIEELAKEHARTGESHSDIRYVELLDEYISSVSPDRESILKNAATEIHGRLNPQGNSDYSMSAAFQQIDSQRTQKKDEDEKEPIDYFLEALKNKGKGGGAATSGITKNGSYHTVKIDHGGGMITYLNYANGEFASMNLEGNNYFVGGIDNSNGAVRAAEFYDDNGEKIMDFNGNDDGFGLSQAYTKEEGERLQEILAVYSAAYRSV